MWQQAENPYKKEAEQIHAPAELVERTRAALRMEEADLENKKKKRIHKWGVYAAAACISIAVLGVYGGYKYRVDNFVEISEIKVADRTDSWQTGISLGQRTESFEDDGSRQEKVTVVSGTDRSAVPEALWEIPASRINKTDVYIGYDEQKGIYYAAWEKEGICWLAYAGEMKKKDFLKYLKETI